MSKRSAQGPHGSKDDDPFLEMSSTPNEAPQRATAAQLASRKIKDIRRRPRGTTPTGGSGSDQPSNAFGGISASSISSPAPSFGAPAPQSGGFTFGQPQTQSQSFPGATSSSTQPTQNSSTPFSFGGGAGAQSSFNFGASSGGFGSSSFNNPFANGAGKSDPTPATQNSSFTGFNFGNQPASQPAQSSQPAFSFGAQTVNAPSTSGMFGQSNTTNSAASPADSMQMSPDAKPKTASTTPSSFQSRSLFGESAANPFSPKPAAAASNPFSNLNGSAAADKPASDKAEGITSKPAFAGQSTPAPSQTAPFGNLFGASATAAKPSEAEKPAPTNLFGTGSSQSAFAGLSASKPTPDQATPNNIFGQKSAPEQKTDTSANANPFKNLLGATAPAQFASQSQTTPAQNLFAPKPATEQTPSKPAESQPFKNLFGGAAASSASNSEPQQPASTPSAPTNLFSSKPAMDQSTTKPADATPFKSLFGASTDQAKPSETPREEQSPAQNLFSAKPAAAQPTSNNIFAPKPNPDQAPEKPANTNPFGSLLGASTSKANASEPEPAKPQSTPAPNLFASSTTSQVNSSGGLFGPKPDATTAPSTSAASLKNTPNITNSQPVAPPQIPKSEFAKSADKSNAQLINKLRMLDTILKEELSTYQPGVDGFDNLIIYYMGMRQALGAPVGSKNGWKTSGAVPTTNGQVAKDSAAINGANDSATSSVFAQSFSSPAKPAEPAKTLTSSSASPAKQPENPFAKISTSTQAASPAPASKNSETSVPSKLAGNMFANPQASQGSAAPLSMPKFGNGASGEDFMAQFKKKAEESAAKEKAKRKAEDFDSDEDDEEEWERRDAEKQREKLANLESSSKKKTLYVPGKGFSFVDVEEEAQDGTEKPALPAPSPAPSSGSIFDSSSKAVPVSQNIFGRISSTTPQPADEDNDGNASDEAKPPSPKRSAPGDEDDSEHKAKRSKAAENDETSKSSLDTPIPEPTAAAGRSLFDRIESPTPSFASPKPSTSGIDFGASVTSNSGNPFASLGAKSQTSQLFGSSFNTSSAQPSTTSPTPADNTWKPTTPIKFASDTNSASNQPSTEASAQTSGAENATSGAATPDEESAPGSIFDMSSANAGEEDETVIFECRARAFKLTTGWVSQGTGTVRLLKHPGTGRARVVLRADPGGNIILNALLKKELDYARTSNSMQFMVPQADGKPEQWAVRVKAESIDSLNEKIQAIKN